MQDSTGFLLKYLNQKAQAGIIVVGAKVIMKNNQIARYLGFNEGGKFEKRVADFCY